MERYINSYATENDIQIALQNGELLKPYVAYIEDADKIDWNSKEKVDYTTEYLTFNILSAGTINWTASNTAVTKTIDYKLNDNEWASITSNTGSSAPTITVNSGDKIQFRGNNAQYATDYYSNYNSFGGSASFEVEGNIMSLIYGDNFKNNSTLSRAYALAVLFQNCTKLFSAENLVLPATTLKESCYRHMFEGCTSLTTAPKELPATTSEFGCCDSMFKGCTSLTTAPELPATTLANYCYESMFEGCTSLTTAPSTLPANTLVYCCYDSMFKGCTSLTQAPVLPATDLATRCYDSMFYDCTSLTVAPELPATTFATNCYLRMFYGCKKLNYIKCLASDSYSTDCTYFWVYSVASTGTFVKASSMTSWTTGDSGIPTGWTVQDA